MPRIDLVRAHYRASFNTLPNAAAKCGMTPGQMRRFMEEEAWAFQKPPSLAFQNRTMDGLGLLDAVERPEKRIDAFVRDFEGRAARINSGSGPG